MPTFHIRLANPPQQMGYRRQVLRTRESLNPAPPPHASPPQKMPGLNPCRTVAEQDAVLKPRDRRIALKLNAYSTGKQTYTR